METIFTWPVVILAGVAYYFYRRDKHETALNDVYSLLHLSEEMETSRGNYSKSKELGDIACAIYDARRYVKYKTVRPHEKPTDVISLLATATCPHFLEELYRHNPGGRWNAYNALMGLWGKLEKHYK